MSAAAAEPSAGPSKAIPLLDGLILLCLLIVGGYTFVATAIPGYEQAMREPLGWFYRAHLVGLVKLGGGRIIPWWMVQAVVGALLFVMALLKTGPDARAGTAGLGFVLLLAPVIGYAPQINALATFPEDAQILGLPVLDRFHPFLVITWPLLVGLLALAALVFLSGRQPLGPAAKAIGYCWLLLVMGGPWLNKALVAARGNALRLDYYQWPYGIASVWVLGQLGAAALLAAAVGRDERWSRAVAALTAVLLCSAAAVGRVG